MTDMHSFNVRQLAAIDMWGSRGTMLRRRIILAEFVLGVLGATALGIWLLGGASDWIDWVFIVWVIGVGINYVPLAAHAISLIGPGALEEELAGVDVASELRSYTLAQFRIFVPLWVALLGLAQVLSDR